MPKNIDNKHPQRIQLNLFQYIERLQHERTTGKSSAEGSCDIEKSLQLALNLSIKQSNLSRHQIAGEMSHLTGREITKTQIDAWTAESKSSWQIPARYIPAFCRVTKSNAVLDIINMAAGSIALPGPEALQAEISRYAAAEKQARAEKQKRKILLEHLQNGKISLPGDRRGNRRRIDD